MSKAIKFSKGLILNTKNSTAIVSGNGDITIKIPRSSSFVNIIEYDEKHLKEGEGALSLENGSSIILNTNNLGFNFSSDGDNLILNLSFAVEGKKKEHAQ